LNHLGGGGSREGRGPLGVRSRTLRSKSKQGGAGHKSDALRRKVLLGGRGCDNSFKKMREKKFQKTKEKAGWGRRNIRGDKRQGGLWG